MTVKISAGRVSSVRMHEVYMKYSGRFYRENGKSFGQEVSPQKVQSAVDGEREYWVHHNPSVSALPPESYPLDHPLGAPCSACRGHCPRRSIVETERG